MTIEVAGKRFVTLADEFFVNGAKVYEAYANGVKVYPDEEKYDINAIRITYDPVESGITPVRTVYVYTPGLGTHDGRKSTLGSNYGAATILVTQFEGYIYAAAESFSREDYPSGKVNIDMFDFTSNYGWLLSGGTSARAGDYEFEDDVDWFDDKSAIPESFIDPTGIRLDDPSVTINIIEG